MVVDTETTGLPPRYAPVEALEAWEKCRVVQIAWEIYDEAGKHISSECYIIRPDGYTIRPEVTRIHGISHTHAEQHGIPFDVIIDRLACALPRVKRIVAHNISFDDRVVQAELYRYCDTEVKKKVMTQWREKQKLCTMLRGTKPGEKWPKLVDLYKRYFGGAPSEEMHRADADVRACARIYHHQEQELNNTL
jgi:DNA polymerase III epsilon subunit-like protein